jgi:hypothetical protein
MTNREIAVNKFGVPPLEAAAAIWSAPPTAALRLPMECSSRTVSCEESQSGGVAAALQISFTGWPKALANDPFVNRQSSFVNPQ